MNFEIKGKVGVNLNQKRALEVIAKEEKIILKVKKISGIKKVLNILDIFSQKDEDSTEEEIEDKKEIREILKFLKNQGYPVSIKLKGMTIIKDLESSKLAKLTKFL